jgi:hypothetical protein
MSHSYNKRNPKKGIESSITWAFHCLNVLTVTTKEIPKRELREHPLGLGLIYVAYQAVLQQKKSQKGN